MNIMPEMISTYGDQIDSLGKLITICVGIGFVIAQGLLFAFIFKYRKNNGAKAEYISGESWKQLRFVLVPVAIVFAADIMIDIQTASTWNTIKEYVPEIGRKIKITGTQFAWNFTYAGTDNVLGNDDDFQTTNDLYVQENEDVIFFLEAKEVIHSFSVPVLRLKQDAVPGRTIRGWFKATKAGDYDIMCTQICGTGHTVMKGTLHVLPYEKYHEFIASKGASVSGSVGTDPASIGANLYRTKTCVACHTTDGTKLVGPSFKGLWGKMEDVVTSGKDRKVSVDEAYIAKSIKDPNADITKGFPAAMPPLPLTDEEIKNIIEYLKTLK